MRETTIAKDGSVIDEDRNIEAEEELVHHPDFDSAMVFLDQARQFRAQGLNDVAESMEQASNGLLARMGRDGKEALEKNEAKQRAIGKFIEAFIVRLNMLVRDAGESGGNEFQASLKGLVESIIKKSHLEGLDPLYDRDELVRKMEEILDFQETGMVPIEDRRDRRAVNRTPFLTRFNRIVGWKLEVIDPQLRQAVSYSPEIEVMNNQRFQEFSKQVRALREPERP